MSTLRDEFRSQLRLALPIIVVQLGMMAMGVADIIMVGHHSTTDLAAVALGNAYAFLPMIFGLGTLMALDPIVAQAVGAKDEAAIASGLQRGLLLAAALSVVLAIPMLLAAPLLRAAGQPEELIPGADGFVRVTALSLPAWHLFIALRQTLQALGKLRAIVAVIVAANAVNIGLNLVLIPKWGAVGCSVSSSIARWFMALGLLALVWPTVGPLLSRWSARWPEVGSMLRVGAPIGAAYVLELGAFSSVAWFMGRLGSQAVAGHQVALNLASVTFMVPLAIGQAAAVRVGYGVGARDPLAMRRAARSALTLGIGFMSCTALMFFFFPAVLARLYTDEGAVLSVAVGLIPLAAAFQIFDGVQVVCGGILRGIGDTRVPMLVCLFGYWGCGIPVSLALAFGAGMGAPGLWWGFVVGLGAVAVVLALRVKTGLFLPSSSAPTPRTR